MPQDLTLESFWFWAVLIRLLNTSEGPTIFKCISVVQGSDYLFL